MGECLSLFTKLQGEKVTQRNIEPISIIFICILKQKGFGTDPEPGSVPGTTPIRFIFMSQYNK